MSPVIGVILMVAITVILAAVIGAFVLEIGDQQETAPSTSFDSEQASSFYQDSAPGNFYKTNASVVGISHAGGDVLDVTQTELSVEGNDSVWGVEQTTDGGNPQALAHPQPDFRPALGSNQPVEFTSGERWTVFVRGGVAPAGAWGSPPPTLAADEYVDDAIYEYRFRSPSAGHTPGDGPEEAIRVYPEGNLGASIGFAKKLETGNAVRVVWTAESGGKTQTLFKYNVQ